MTLQRAKLLSSEIDVLAPAMARDRRRPGQCESPWEDAGAELHVPRDWTFALSGWPDAFSVDAAQCGPSQCEPSRFRIHSAGRANQESRGDVVATDKTTESLPRSQEERDAIYAQILSSLGDNDWPVVATGKTTESLPRSQEHRDAIFAQILRSLGDNDSPGQATPTSSFRSEVRIGLLLIGVVLPPLLTFILMIFWKHGIWWLGWLEICAGAIAGGCFVHFLYKARI